MSPAPIGGPDHLRQSVGEKQFQKTNNDRRCEKEKRRAKFGFLRLGHVGDREVGILYLSEWLSVLTVDIMLLLLLLLLSSPSEKLGHEFGRILKGAV